GQDLNGLHHLVIADLARVDKVGHAELFRHFDLGRIDVHADDLVRAHHAGTLNDIEADAAETEHHDIGARTNLCRINHRANAGGDAAADIADLVERRVFAHFRHRDFRQNREVGEGRA